MRITTGTTGLMAAASFIAIAAGALAPQQALAEECLLDTTDDGSATAADTDAGADGSGADSLACGAGATASGAYSVALGAEAWATHTASTAIGAISSAEGNYAVAVGALSIASGSYANAIGYSAQASGADATAIGHTAIASGVGALALGFSTTSSGDLSSAIGPASKATGKYRQRRFGHSRNAADIASNSSAIGTNAGNIATNAAGIATNAIDIAGNASAIATNTADISTNASAIATNSTRHRGAVNRRRSTGGERGQCHQPSATNSHGDRHARERPGGPGRHARLCRDQLHRHSQRAPRGPMRSRSAPAPALRMTTPPPLGASAPERSAPMRPPSAHLPLGERRCGRNAAHGPLPAVSKPDAIGYSAGPAATDAIAVGNVALASGSGALRPRLPDHHPAVC